MNRVQKKKNKAARKKEITIAEIDEGIKDKRG
jgi:hypothetical protein